MRKFNLVLSVLLASTSIIPLGTPAKAQQSNDPFVRDPSLSMQVQIWGEQLAVECYHNQNMNSCVKLDNLLNTLLNYCQRNSRIACLTHKVVYSSKAFGQSSTIFK